MTKARSMVHATFKIEKTYPQPPDRVFRAWGRPELKIQWFKGPDEWERGTYELDFRIGGREVSKVGPKGGSVHGYEAFYHDIVDNERIVYAYDMYLDDTRISVSLATVSFAPDGTGTRLVFNELGTYLDGYDDAGKREYGTNELLKALGQALAN
jgi:uncharacterized protein YndB with AHSA1/START domain